VVQICMYVCILLCTIVLFNNVLFASNKGSGTFMLVHFTEDTVLCTGISYVQISR